MDQEEVQKLLNYKIDLQVLISTDENPQVENSITTLSMQDYISVDENNQMIAKTNEVVAVPEFKPIYVKVVYKGSMGSFDDLIYYQITMNSLTKIDDFKNESVQYIQLREDGYDQAFFFNSYNTDLINFKLQPFQNKATSGTYQCNSIEQVEVVWCVGVMPLINEMKNAQTLEQCQVSEMNTDGTISFSLDSQEETVTTGVIYGRITYQVAPGQSIKQISQCFTQTLLYRNEYIYSNYQETRFAGSVRTKENPYYLYADIPAIYQTAAKEDGSTYGDRLLLSVQANQPVQICVSDELENYYPMYSTSSQSCNIYFAQNEPGIDQQVIYFKNYKNQNIMGQIQPFTRIYMSVFAYDNDSNSVQTLTFNISVVPQVYTYPEDQVIFTWMSQSLHGISDYVSVAVNVKGYGLTEELLQNSSVVAGYYCNYSYCRQNIPDSFYVPSIATFVSTVNKMPSLSNLTKVIGRNVAGGKQVVPLTNVTGDVEEIYIGVQNRLGQSNYNNPFAVYLLILYGSENELSYQSIKYKISLTNTQALDYYHALIPYEDTELVLYPCRGWPALLIDSVSPQSTPGAQDYETQLVGEWGKAISYHWTDEKMIGVNQFITVYDNALYDTSTGKIVSTTSNMKYELFIGSQAEINVPGNDGQITIIDFSPDSGKLTVRFYPARQADQIDDVSQVNYYFYVVPYLGSFDTENDYTPYTKCGVQFAGYSVYSDEYGNERLIIDETELIEKGYIEITNNLELFQNGADKNSILYVNIFAEDTGYQGILVGKTELTLSALMGISVAVMVVIVVSLIVIFYVLYYREMKRKSQGYNEVL